jgi:hypothetical protein
MYPDHLEVTVSGVPRLNVTMEEVGLSGGWQFWWSGVGGPTGRKCHPDWRLRPWLDRIMTGPTAGLGSAG